jgi:maltose O-acetyltransferase
VNAALLGPLTTISRVLGSATPPEPGEVAGACRAISLWADGQGLLRTALEFAAARKPLLRAYRAARRASHRLPMAMALHDLFCVAALFGEVENANAYARAAFKAYGPRNNRIPKLAHDVARFWMLQGATRAEERPMGSERQKMLAGELYDPMDPELVAARERARDLCQALNATREAEHEERRRILRELFGSGGDTVWMQPPFFCDYGSNIELEKRVFFNFNCIVLDVCPVRIGSFTLLGPAVQIYTAMHPFNAELRRRAEFGKPVEIGSDVWVGGGAIILPGVRIGSRAVIGAGSVVTRDIPEGVFAAGNPCRVIREITE